MVGVKRGAALALALTFGLGWSASGCGGNAKTESPSNAGVGGSDATAGAAGDRAGDAGQGGEPGAAGKGGSAGGEDLPGEGGAAGESAAACQTQGNAISVTFASDYTPVCRGMKHSIAMHAGGLSDLAFTCCAAFDASSQGAFPMNGKLEGGLDGRFSFTVPKEAPLGIQQPALECGLGGTLQPHVEVYERPVLISVSATIHASDEMRIAGVHLGLAAFVALPLDGSVVVPQCIPKVTHAPPDDTEASCWFDEIAPGDYTLRVDTGGCSAATQLPFKVLP